MQILIKYPTRGRPDAFLSRLREWTAAATRQDKIAFLISYDEDDATMTPEVLEQAASIHPNMVLAKGVSKTKIEACNADLNTYLIPWDVVLLLSDDMFCRRQGWDEIIRENMTKHFPDTDGGLWFYDSAQKLINTLTCFGRAYYRRFNYLYHPSYASFFSDNEQTDVGLRDGKLAFIEHAICSHEHPSWCGGMKRDATYIRNNRYWQQDRATYARRKAEGFPF